MSFIQRYFLRHPIRTKRALEILPGSVSWFLILFPLWGSLIIPEVVAVYIIAFTVYWLYKSLSVAVFSLIGHFRLEASQKFDWMGDVAVFPDWAKIHHIVVIPTYQEPEGTLIKTLEALSLQTYPLKKIHIILSLGWAAKKRNIRIAIPVFESISEDKISSEMRSAGLPVSGKVRLIDGRTGELFKEETVVGVAYIMKLSHMVEDKLHARSTGPYSLVTQQPLGGKAQMGGQRLGEMEVWALEAHRAAHTLQEMLTIKSDDVVGRAKAFEAIVKGEEIPEAMIPESFKVLMKELNSLVLDVIPTRIIEAVSPITPQSGGPKALPITDDQAAGATDDPAVNTNLNDDDDSSAKTKKKQDKEDRKEDKKETVK